MRRWLKILAKLAAAFLVLILAAAALAPFLLKKYLPPERVRELIVTNARKALRREVSLGGISYSLKGLSARELAISERPDFKAGSFITLKNFALKIQWLPLLRRQLVVDKVSVEGLRVSLVRRKDGLFNFSDLMGSSVPAKGQPAPAPAALGFALAASQATLADGRITFKDLGTGDSWDVSGIEARLRHFRLEGPFSAELALKAEGKALGRRHQAGLSFSGKVNLGGQDPKRFSTEVKKFSLDYSGLRLELAGKLSSLEAPKAELKFSLASKQGLLEGEISGSFGLPPKTAAQADFKLKTPGFKGSELAALRGFGLPAAAEKLALPAAKVSGKVDLKGEDLGVQALKLETGLGSLEASGKVSRLASGKPEPDLSLSANLALPAFKSADLAWLKDFKLRVPEGLVFPATQVQAQGRYAREDVSLKALKLSTERASLEASGSVRLAGSKPKADLAASVKLDLPRLREADLAFLKSFGLEIPQELSLPPTKLEARARFKEEDLNLESLRLRSEGASLDASGWARRLLSGKPDLDLSALLKLELPPVTAKDLAALKIAKLKIPEKLSWPAASLEAQGRFRGEDLDLGFLRLRAPGVQLDLSGTVKRLGASPDPSLKVAAKLDLPAFTSAEVAFVPGLPEGLNIPASKLDLEASGGLEALDVKFFRLVTGNNNLALQGKLRNLKKGPPAFDLTMVCKSFVLEELTKFSAQTREMKLAGSGRFNLKVAQKPPERPFFVGNLEFKGLGATVAGLALADFSGSGRFDERRIDFPRIAGKVAEGNLEMDLTVKNYVKAPAIDIQQVRLDVFDLGKFLAARAAVKAPPAPQAPAQPQAAKPAAAPAIDFRCRSFDVKKILHASFSAENLHLAWDLTGITPDFKALSGDADLHVGGGKFENLGRMGTQSAFVKILILPFMLLQKLSGVLGHKLFPDFNNVVFHEIAGKYAFKNGRMKLIESRLESSVAHVETQGEVDLPSERLNLLVYTKTQTIPPISLNVNVSGTASQPVTKLGVGKFLQDTATGIVTEPAKQILNIFKK